MKEEMGKTYFEVHGEELLRERLIKKTDFAERMGIKKQNVKALFATKNINMLRQAAEVLDVPFERLIAPADEVPEVEVSGFVEVGGQVFRIRDKEDLIEVMEKVEAIDAANKENVQK